MDDKNTVGVVYDMISFFCQNESVFLYGAGKYASIVTEVLRGLGLNPAGYCVTRRTQTECCHGLPIYVFPDVDRPLGRCGFIFALSELHRSEVIGNVKSFVSDKQIFLLDDETVLFFRAYLHYRTTAEKPNIIEWYKNLYRLTDCPCVLLKRDIGLGDVLSFEPIARKLKLLGYNILIATKFPDVYMHTSTADGVFGCVKDSKFIEERCLVLDFTYAYAISPFKDILNGYVDFVKNILPEFSLSADERLPIYDSTLIREHTDAVKKICINNEATEWDSRRYPQDRMKLFAEYLKNSGYEIYEIGVDKQKYLGVGENCYGMKLHDSVRVMSETDMYVGVDNGLFHLAQSVKLPVFALFGCVCPVFRVHDWQRARILWKNTDDLYCAGCWSRRRLPCDVVKCDRDKVYCMD